MPPLRRRRRQDPLARGNRAYVHDPTAAGNAYYAMTVVRDGKEDTSLGEGNVTREALAETVGQGEPVLQKIEKDVRVPVPEGHDALLLRPLGSAAELQR